MRTALGVLRIAPSEFWSMTMIEFNELCAGIAQMNNRNPDLNPMTVEEFEELKRRYPDGGSNNR